MTAIRFTRAAGRGSISAAALYLALGAPIAFAQETLPTIEVGRKATTPSAAASAAPAPKPKPAPVVAQRPKPAPANAPLTQPQKPGEASSLRTYTEKDVTDRIYAQPQEALEIVPGLVIAQHSGSGKAAQYFLRGFALDHGYDIGLTIDGMPMNQMSHVHSNGYADGNFLMPELFSDMEVRKGPYDAEYGSIFSSVGSVHMQYVDKLREGLVDLSGGSFAYADAKVAKSWGLGAGELLLALEGNIYNGPWERPDEERKINGVARWSMGTQENGLSVTAMAYSNHYFATDQIPYADVAAGLMSRWGTEDPTDGGNASRYSVSTRWSETNKNDWSRIEAYFIHNDTNLYDDFTYQLANPVTGLLAGTGTGLGDQTHQFDHRQQFGLNAVHGWKYNFQSVPVETRVGLQTLNDFIHNGNGDSFMRQQYDSITDNWVKESYISPWTDTTQFWKPWLRTTEGLRLDYVFGSVNNIMNPLLAQGSYPPGGSPFYLGSLNNGTLDRLFTSPKAGLVLGPFNNTEFFLNFGEGLRAEDIRGATNHFATDGTQYSYIPNVPFLTKTRGAETGVRAKPIEGLDTTLTLFWQDLDAEQTFNADSGTSTYGRPGRRYGFEWTGTYQVNPWMHLDGEVTGTHARFRGFDTIQAVNFASYLSGGPGSDGGLWPLGLPGLKPGNYLMLAPVWVATGGVEVGEKTGWFGRLSGRYFGARPLTEDGSIESHATFTLQARAGYRFQNGWKIMLDGFNIANSRSDMIDYQANYFGRQDFALLPGYTGGSALGISGRVFKPIDPPAFRITISGPLSFDGTPSTSLPHAETASHH
ncbi:MAG: TonB-dependent receptor plug domain-containing protein [Methylocystis sp.]